jgi:hypothetical protein
MTGRARSRAAPRRCRDRRPAVSRPADRGGGPIPTRRARAGVAEDDERHRRAARPAAARRSAPR